MLSIPWKVRSRIEQQKSRAAVSMDKPRTIPAEGAEMRLLIISKINTKKVKSMHESLNIFLIFSAMTLSPYFLEFFINSLAQTQVTFKMFYA